MFQLQENHMTQIFLLSLILVPALEFVLFLSLKSNWKYKKKKKKEKNRKGEGENNQHTEHGCALHKKSAKVEQRLKATIQAVILTLGHAYLEEKTAASSHRDSLHAPSRAPQGHNSLEQELLQICPFSIKNLSLFSVAKKYSM